MNAATTKVDRDKLLQDLDLRHERLLEELDDLNMRIEQALAGLRPGSPAGAAASERPRQPIE